MNKIIVALLGICLAINTSAQSLKISWLDQIGGPQWDVLSGMASTPDGKLVVAGSFYDSITIKDKTYQSKGSRDCFITVYNPDGSIYKSITLGGNGYEYIKRIEITENDGILAVIKFERKTSVGEKQIIGKALNNYLFAYFDNALNPLNQKMISCDRDFDVTGLTATNKNKYAFTGWYSGNLFIGDKTLASEKDVCFFQGKIDAKGNLFWIKQYESPGETKAGKLKSDDSDGSYLTGTTQKGNFEGLAKPKEVPGNMKYVFEASTRDNGEINSVIYPAYGYDIEPVDVVKDNNLVWILANFSSPVFIAGEEIKTAGMGDILLIRYDITTQKTSYHQLGGYGNDQALGMVKSADQLIVTGSFTDALTAGPYTVKASPRGPDVFIAAFSNDGRPQTLISLKGDKIEYPGTILATEKGVYLGGEYTGTMSSTTSTIGSCGDKDIFVAYIENCDAANPPKIVSTPVDSRNPSKDWELNAGNGYKTYSWGNGAPQSQYYTVTTPGTYTVKVASFNGCEYTASIQIPATKSAKLPREPLAEHEFSLYPTVTNGPVNWQPATAWLQKEANVYVTNMDGKTVMNTTIQSTEDCFYSLDLSGNPTGAYIVHVQGEGFHESIKVIVKR